MGLNVKRSAVLSLKNRMDLGTKGVAVNLEGRKLRELLDSLKKNNSSKNNSNNNSGEEFSLMDFKTIHHNFCTEILWNELNNMNPPYDINSDGPNKSKALKEYENYEPGFLEKIFKFLQPKKKEQLLNYVDEAEKKDEALCFDYKKINELSRRIIQGDIDCYFQVIDEMRVFDILLSLGSEIEIGTNNSDSMEVEFKANSEKVIPRSRFNEELMDNYEDGDTSYYELVEEYVGSSILLIAKNIMNLIPVNKVVVHGVDNVVNVDKGMKNDTTIISIVFDRDTLNKLNMRKINPVDAFDYFICNIRHQKTSGFKSVERIVQY